MESYPEMTCLLTLNVQSSGWEKALTRMLRQIRGVTSFNINAAQGTSQITGRVHPDDLLRMLSRSTKHAQISWVQYGNSNAQQYYDSPYERGCYNGGGDYLYGNRGRASNYYYLNQPHQYSSPCQYPPVTAPACYHLPIPDNRRKSLWFH